MTKVVHCKRQAYDVCIGRPSKWGNPFSNKPGTLAEMKVDSVEEAIACYEEYVRRDAAKVQAIKEELRGKVLGCWCSPNPCHGDVLAKIAEEP